MMKLILFEFKKMIRTKLVAFLLLVTVATIVGLFIRNVIQQDVIQKEKIEQFSDYLNDVVGQVMTDRMMLEDNFDSEIQARLERGGELSGELNTLLAAIEKKDWQTELQTEINVYNLATDYIRLKGDFNVSAEEREIRMKLNQELLKLGLPKENHDLSLQTSLFMKKMVSLLLTVGGFLILLLALGTVITKEFEGGNIKLVYTLPISRRKYVIVKFVSILAVSYVWLLTVFAVAYLLPALFGHHDEKSFTYPLLNKLGNFINTGTYMNEAVVYSVCFVTFAVAISVLISFLVRNTIISLLLIFGLFIGGYLVSNQLYDSVWIPFAYQNVDDVILTSLQSFSIGISVLIGSAFILLVLTMEVNRKRGV